MAEIIYPEFGKRKPTEPEEKRQNLFLQISSEAQKRMNRLLKIVGDSRYIQHINTGSSEIEEQRVVLRKWTNEETIELIKLIQYGKKYEEIITFNFCVIHPYRWDGRSFVRPGRRSSERDQPTPAKSARKDQGRGSGWRHQPTGTGRFSPRRKPNSPPRASFQVGR